MAVSVSEDEIRGVVAGLKSRAALALPSNGSCVSGVVNSINGATREPIFYIEWPSSVLTDSFNTCWCHALNRRPRPEFFAMHHADVLAQPGWLDLLIAEIERTEAGVVAAAIAIKDTDGLTSTAVLDPVTHRHRRITMRELVELPETFGVEDIPWAPKGAVLCTNTGLWACRFGAWCEKIVFTIQDFITRSEDGMFRSSFWPEDWNFAVDCARLGVRVLATRKISIEHMGGFNFKNDRAWGKVREDDWHATPPFRSAVESDRCRA